jgi:hypothetical protein|tara:strand:+ start:18443 stop:18658 length:216 start_codon:yes stop_codon:yes gene_type:complete
MEYQDKYDKLIEMITDDFNIDDKEYNLKDDFEKFFVKGNKAAGARIRKIMQELKNLAQEIRVDVQSYKNSL